MIDQALSDLEFARGETLELLGCLDDELLGFKPEGERWQTMAYQFACMARTQLVYAQALARGEMNFADFADPSFPDKHAHRTGAELRQLLDDADTTFRTAAQKVSQKLAGKGEVRWPEAGPVNGASHIYRLLAHERLHHGQLIAYFTLAGLELPPHFTRTWAL